MNNEEITRVCREHVAGLQQVFDTLTKDGDRLRAENDVVGLVRLMDLVDTINTIVARPKAAGAAIYDRIRFALLPESMENKAITTIGVDGVGQCYLTDDMSVSAPDKDRLKVWLVENQLEDMISESINAQTLASFVKRRMKAGEELPFDMLHIRPFTRAAIKSKI